MFLDSVPKDFDCVHVWTKHLWKYHFVSFQVSKFVSVRANSNWFKTNVCTKYNSFAM